MKLSCEYRCVTFYVVIAFFDSCLYTLLFWCEQYV